MKRSTLIATGTALILGLAAMTVVSVAPSFAASEATKSEGARHDGRGACFDPDWVRGFQTKDDHTVIIMSSDNKAYELEVGGVCIGLDSSFQLGIRSRHGMSQVCGPFDADIVYDDLGRGLQSCPITSVRLLEGEEAAPYIYTRGERKGDRDGREQTRVNSGRDGR